MIRSRFTEHDLDILRAKALGLWEADFRSFDEARVPLARSIGTGPGELSAVELDQLERIFRNMKPQHRRGASVV